MINIGNIGFNFRMKDETFTHDMYARWDNYYREAIHDIIEGVLSRHDKEEELIRLDRLELNLGDISQKDFYQQFPIRLKEELEREFSYRSMQTGSRESAEEQIQRRLASLMFYLEKGFCPTIWEDAEFNMEQEMQFLLLHAPRLLADLFHKAIGYPERLRRMIWRVPGALLGRVMLLWVEDKHIPQDEKEMCLMELAKENHILLSSLHEMVCTNHSLSEKLSVLLEEEKDENYMSWLLNTTISVYEKRRSLARLLDTKPAVVIRFIHETQDEKSIRSLAGLLDRVMVRQVINKESENHAEVDVPDYWMYLYNWLIKNYPFNGVYMFGNKMQFKEYLNVKLLHFIRKRSSSAYLSKAELTVQFLIEVFGQEYYLEVLNIIYNQQERNMDGSPVYTGYFNMELYYMFLRLSLIKIPVCMNKTQGGPISFDAQALMLWLTDTNVNPAEKRSFLALLADRELSVIIQLIKEQNERPQNLTLLAECIDESFAYRLMSSVSLYATELFIRLVNILHSEAGKIKWLSGVNSDSLMLSIRTVLLHLVGAGEKSVTNSREAVVLFLQLLYKELSGAINNNVPLSSLHQQIIEDTVDKISGHLYLSERIDSDENGFIGLADDILNNDILSEKTLAGKTLQEDAITFTSSLKWIGHLRSLLGNVSVDIVVKQRILAWQMEVYRNHCDRLVTLLKEHSLLRDGVAIMDGVLLEQLVVRLAKKGNAQHGITLIPFYRWILTHTSYLGTFFSGGTVELKEKITILLADWAVTGLIRNMNISEIGKMFLTELFGKENVARISQYMYRSLISDLSMNESSYKMHETEFVLKVLLQQENSFFLEDKMPISDSDIYFLLQQDFAKWSHVTEKNEKSFRLIFEKYLDQPASFVAWVKQDGISKELKKKLLQNYISEHSYDFIRLLRQIPAGSTSLSLLMEIWKTADILELISRISSSKAEVLSKIIGIMQQHPNLFSIMKESGWEQENIISKALLLFLLDDEKVFEQKTVCPEEIIRQLIYYLHLSYAGQATYEPSEEIRWQQFEMELAGELEKEKSFFDHLHKNPETTPYINEDAHVPSQEQQLPKEKSLEKEHSLTSIAEIPIQEWNESTLTNWLKDSRINTYVKQSLLRQYLIWQPIRMLSLVRKLVNEKVLSIDEWASWLDKKDWIRMVAGISLYKAELLEQIIEYLLHKQIVSASSLQTVMIRFLIERDPESWIREAGSETVKRFVRFIRQLDNENDAGTVLQIISKQEMEQIIINELLITKTEKEMAEKLSSNAPEYISVSNAGVVLLTPWFVRLFSMLELLNEDKKDFKNMESRIRAIFIIQRLVTFEDRVYEEKELAFNRILVDCPFSEPLPAKMELTEKELETVESMLNGVKGNWDKMRNTSIKGFQLNFIERSGHIEQQEDKWHLSVDTRSYDILLDSLPWPYSLVRLPWVKKQIHVSWRTRSEF